MKWMMMLMLLIAVDGYVAAQTPLSITGQVIGLDKLPVEGAVVTVMMAKDSQLVKATITDAGGRFELPCSNKDTMVLTVTHTGFIAHTQTGIIGSQNQAVLSLPVIVLRAAAGMELETVTVTGKVPFIERKIDRVVVNPDALIANAGSTVLDVLEKSPGVMVDINGIISLKGKQGVLVYVDDKPTYLSVADLAGYLKSIAASSLGQIEIISNPPARYDAAGNAGIINIKLKRTRTTGFNGALNVSYGQGTYARNNNSLTANVRINRFNFFSNLGYTVNNNYQDLYINRSYFYPGGLLSSLFNQHTYIRMHNTGVNLKAGLDFYATAKATAGIVISGFDNRYQNSTTNFSEISDGNRVLQNKVTAISPMNRHFSNKNINLNYVTKSGGRELAFNADHIRYQSVQDQSLLSKTYEANGALASSSNLVSRLPATITINAVKLDYVVPCKINGKLEAGAKTSFIQTANVADFYDEVNSVLTPNYTFSNQFDYNENINAAYINYSVEKKRFSFQAGLRYENTSIEGKQFGNPQIKDTSFSKPYHSLFPTLYLSYQADTSHKHVLGFSFGRRIDRPNYQSMNPFTYPLDRFTLYSGNPFLQPTFSYNFELSHTYRNSITTTIQYSYVQNVISETIEQRANTFYSRPGNIGSQHAFGVSVNASRQLTAWWSLQLYVEVMSNVFKSALYNQQLYNKGVYGYAAPVCQFVLGKKWTAELAATWQSSVATGQFITTPVWSLRAGASRPLFNNKGTIKFNFNDVFFSNEPGGSILALGNSKAGWHSKLDTRVFTVAVGYRFKKGKVLPVRNTGASDAEKGRVK